MPEYWYLWLILIALLIILLITARKASAAARRRHERMQKEIAAIEREKALRSTFRTLTPALLRDTPMPDLLEGVATNIQIRIEQAPDMTAAFLELPIAEQYCYTLHYFLTDAHPDLREFFRRNGEPLLSLAPAALEAVGSTLFPLVRQLGEIYDEENESTSFDEERVAAIEKEYADAADESLLHRQIQSYIQSNF